MQYRQQAEEVLALWRAVERELDVTPSGTREAEELQTRAVRLRDEYQRLMAEAAAANGDPVTSAADA